MKQDETTRLHPLNLLPFFLLGIIFLLLAAAYNLFSDRPLPVPSATTIPTVMALLVTTPASAVTHQPTPTLIPTLTLTATSPPPTPIPVPTLPPTWTPAPTASFPVGETDEQVEAILRQLSLDQKIGQMVMVGLPGKGVDSLTYVRIVNQNIGGIILLSQNTAGPEQVRALTTELQRVALSAGSGIPLFIAWNEEGGYVSRHLAGMTHFPSNMALGSVNDPNLVFAIGQAVGEEMISLGLNMNYAPVVDVNTHPANPVIGLRAYSHLPAQVSQLGQHYIWGLQSSGVIAVAKHFPGHGGVDVDSHLALPRLESSLAQLQQVELPPFMAAIEAGVAAVMIAHIQIPALDPSERPATLSPIMVTQLLRQAMAFEGVIMTDDMGMAAISHHYTLEQATVQALQAGNDLLITVDTATHPDRMIAAIRQAVTSGLISEAQIDTAVRRILRLKLAYPLAPASDRPLLPNREKHQALALVAGRRAVRLGQDTVDWLPLSIPGGSLVLVSPLQLNPGPLLYNGYTYLGEILLEEGLLVEEIFYNSRNHTSIRQAQAAALNRAPDAFVVVTWDAALRYAQTGDTSQEELVKALLNTGRPVIVVFGALPYDQARLPWAPVQLMMYGDTDGQIEGLVSLLLGQ
jgi:beta-N-acetylhexosaminidase